MCLEIRSPENKYIFGLLAGEVLNNATTFHSNCHQGRGTLYSTQCSSKRGFRHQAPNQFGTRGQIKFLFPGLSVPEGVKVEMFARVINFLHPLAVV